MLRAIIFFLFLAGFAPQILRAEPKIEAKLSEDHVFANQTVIFSIRAEWPKAEGAYSFALPELELENLTFVRQGQSQENFTEGDTLWTRKIFTIELKTGTKQAEGIVGTFTLPYMDPETQKGGVVEITERRLRIHTHTPASLALLIAIAASGLGIGGWFLIRAIKRKKQPSPPVLRDAPELAQVKALVEGRAARSAKELLLDLDATLRQFVTSYYQLGLERGAGEKQILERLRAKELPREEIAPLEKLLNGIGQAKFAASAVTESELRDFQREIINYIETKKVAGTVS